MKYTLLNCLVFSASLAFSQSRFSTIVILDGSGSMWQKIGNAYKKDIARDVLSAYVDKMSKGQAVGLVVYGHRDKSDCQDIETLLASDNTDHEKFKEVIRDINPTGKTPLALSAGHVLNHLKSTGQKASILLITDGLETCEGDLCDVVRQAKEQGIDFVIHIVGFGLGESDRSLLECAAAEGGGMYLDAADADQLDQALEVSARLPVEIAPGRIFAKCVRDGELTDALVRVYKQGETDELIVRRSYKSKDKNPVKIAVPSGVYRVRAELLGARGVMPIEMDDIAVDSNGRELLFDFSAGTLATKVTANGELHDAGISVLSVEDGKTLISGRSYGSASSNPKRMELSPGIYDLHLKSITINGYSEEYEIKAFQIEPGKLTELSHDFEFGTLLVGVRHNQELADASVTVYRQAPLRSVASGRTYTNSTSNPKRFILSPGIYELQIKGLRIPGNPQQKIIVDLSKGQIIEKIIEW